MESKILNFVDAMKLAKILHPYIESLPKEFGGDWVDSLLETLPPEEFLKAVYLLMGKERRMEVKLSGEGILSLIVTGMVSNDITSLIETYERFGLN